MKTPINRAKSPFTAITLRICCQSKHIQQNLLVALCETDMRFKANQFVYLNRFEVQRKKTTKNTHSGVHFLLDPFFFLSINFPEHFYVHIKFDVDNLAEWPHFSK